MSRYAFGKTVALDPAAAQQKVTEVLSKEGFGVLTEIAALLPCKVVVRQDATGKTRVEFMDPGAVLTLVDRPEIGGLAAEVRGRLERVMAAL